MNSIEAIAPFVYATGAILVGPVLTTIMPPETYVGFYVFGAIDALLVGSAILMLYIGFTNTSKPRDSDT